jgi:hypothetical protein
MTRKWLYLIACAVTFAAAPAQSVEPEVSGYVYSFHGSWRIGPQYAVEIARGMAVHAGDKIQLKSSGRPAHLDIGLVNGKLLSNDCETDQECSEVDVPAVSHEKTFMDRLTALMSGFSANQPPLVFTLARSDGASPKESVLRRIRNTVDLAPALEGDPPAMWEVALLPVDEERSIAPVTCRSATRHPACLLAAPKAGLYKLQLSAADSPPATVLILIVDERDYAAAAATFSDAIRVADSWGESVRPATRHYFLSAVLNQLAAESVH